MTRIMNGYFLAHLLGAFGGMLDEEQTEARSTILPNDEDGVKGLIARVIKPQFDRYDDYSQGLMKQNLSYFLTVELDNWERLYESSLPPIDPPDDPREFFVWLWEVLFPGEDYVMPDLTDVRVVHELGAMSQLRTRGFER